MSSVAALRYNNPVPKTQSEFYEIYYPYAIRFVQKYGGISADKAPDVVHSIWVNLLKTDALSQFNPDLVFEHNGQQFDAKFENFIASKLSLYVRHYYHQQIRDRSREFVVDFQDPELGIEQLFGSIEESAIFEDMEERLLVERWTRHLQAVSVKGKPDLVRLFGCVVAQARIEGKLNVRHLAEIFGVSTAVLNRWLVQLRGHLDDARSGKPSLVPQDPTPAPKPVLHEPSIIGGVLVTRHDVQQALEALVAVRSNMIRQPLAAVTNPLAGCDYHGVCAEYRSRHAGFEPTKPRHLEKETFIAALREVLTYH